MRQLQLKVPPLAVCAIFIGAIAAAAHFIPWANVPFPGHRAVAMVALLLGVVVALAGVVQFRLSRTTVNPLTPGNASSIVTTGVYRLSRNPMYLGMAVALLGVAAWWSSLVGYVLVSLFCFYMSELQIKPEERALRERFGHEFLAYAKRVRRWL
jgi:protein-S-isoprenylcysteine O-methyltransferase Ste14